MINRHDLLGLPAIYLENVEVRTEGRLGDSVEFLKYLGSRAYLEARHRRTRSAQGSLIRIQSLWKNAVSMAHAANFPLDERHKRRWPDPAILIDLLKKPNDFADRPRVSLAICDANLEAVWPWAQMVGDIENKRLPGPGAGVDVVDPDFRCHSHPPTVEEHALLEQRAGNVYGLLVGHQT